MASQVAVPTGLHASAFYAPLQSFTNGCHVYLWVSSLVTDTKYNFQEGIVILQSGIACGVFCTGHIFPVPSPVVKTSPLSNHAAITLHNVVSIGLKAFVQQAIILHLAAIRLSSRPFFARPVA